MRPHALHPGAIQGKEGIKFCHLATLARKSKNNSRAPSRKKTKLDQYVVFDLPVDPGSADQCSVCTYDLKDEGMLDDDESEARTLRYKIEIEQIEL